MVGRKQQMLDQVVPSVQEYGSAPVYRERTFPARPTGGYGERVQSSYGDRRYYWAMDAQVAGGLFGKGPLLHPIVPSAAGWVKTTGVKQFVDAIDAGAVKQFILSGDAVLRRDSDTDAGQTPVAVRTGQQPMNAVAFRGGFAGATDSLYVAWDDGVLQEKTAAGVWTSAALPAGFLAQRLEVVGTELWAADCTNSVLRKVTADPKVAANWSGPFLVGDPSVKISAIRQTSNQLVVLKEDGTLYTLNSDGSTNDLFPGAAVPVSADNGLRASAWLNALWFRAGNTFYRLEMPSANLVPTGPGRIIDNASPVRGEMRTFCGWGGYRAYAVLWNPATTTSYLMRYGNWEPHTTDEGTAYTFDDQWDGAEAHWTNRKATAMAVSGATGQDRLYVGFDDGNWDWIKLVPNPFASDSGAEFTLGASELIFPLHHAMFQADLKHWLGFSVFGPVMSPGDEVTLFYRLVASAGAPPMDASGDWLELGGFTNNGQRIPTPSNLVGHAIQLKVSMANTTTADTPVLEIVASHERVVPAFKRDFQMTVDARGYQTRLDGAVARYDADSMHELLMEYAANPGSMALELPDETVNEVALFGYQERMLPMQAGGGRGWAIDIQATQFRVLTVYGIIRRLRGTRIGDLRGYTIVSLKTL